MQEFLEITAKMILSKKHSVETKFLEFIGVQDETELAGVVVYHFNVMDAKHPKYKSTVCHCYRNDRNGNLFC